MTHIVGCVEGYWDFFDKFMKHFHGKYYANGKAKVRARVIIPVHFGINECGRDEFLADLKSFIATEGNDGGDGGKTKKRYFFFSKLLRKMFPKIKPLNLDNIESTDYRNKEGKKGNHFIVGFYPVGEILDGRDENGVEIV